MPEVSFTEYTFRTEFEDGLIQQLGDDVIVVHEPRTTGKRALQPDFLVFRRSNVRIEEDRLKYSSPESIIAGVDTKRSKEDISGDKHLKQIAKYLARFQTQLMFLTNYRELRTFSTRSGRLRDSGSIDYQDMNGVLSAIGRIMRDSAPDIRSLSLDRVLPVLNDAIGHLIFHTERIPTKTLETTLGLDLLISTVDAPTEDEGWKVDLARGAAYLVIAQILFYMVLRKARERTGTRSLALKSLAVAGGVPSNIQSCFDYVSSSLNYQAIFGRHDDTEKKVLLLFDDAETRPVLKRVIEALEGISSELVIQEDLLGHIFQRLLPLQLRKRLAAYYTKPSAARLLSILAINTPEDRVFDPACGSGTLLAAAYNRKRDLGRSSHQKLLEEIYGSDLSPFATSLACVNLAIQNPTGWTDHVSIIREDAFDLRPESLNAHFASQLVSIATPTGRIEKQLEHQELIFDVVIGNPPFTRGRRLPQDERDKLRRIVKASLGLEPRFDLWGLFAFFLLEAGVFLKEEGRIAFVLPHSAISSDYMKEVWRALFKNGFGLEYLIGANAAEQSFSDSSEQEIMAVLKGGYGGPCRMVYLGNHLEQTDILELSSTIMGAKSGILTHEDGTVIQSIPQDLLQTVDCTKWELRPSPFLPFLYQKFVHPEDVKGLEVRGQNASRPADYWWIPNSFWEIVGEQSDSIIVKLKKKDKDDLNLSELRIPKSALTYSMPRSLKDIKDSPPFIQDIEFLPYFIVNEKHKMLSKYRSWGRRRRLTKRFSQQTIRHQVALVAKIDFLTSKTLAISTRFNTVGSGVGMFGFCCATETECHLLLAYLTSSLFILDVLVKGRSRRGEFYRVHKVDFLNKHKIPDIHEVAKNKSATQAILEASSLQNSTLPLLEMPRIYDQVQIARIDTQSPRRKLDESWFSALDLPLSSLNAIYTEIISRIKEFEVENEH